jgi:purine nucleosidase
MIRILLAALLILGASAPASAATPLNVIFDTDMGNDVDDALALAMLHAFASRGEVKLLAVTVSKGNPWAAEYVRMVNEYYGRGNIPVGMVRRGKTPNDGQYVRQVCELHGRHLNSAVVPDAVQLLRKTLAGEPDGAVTLIQVGFSTNLARLMESAPDSFSNLTGMELIRKKVRSLTVMAGNFAASKPEFNVMIDIPAATRLFANWPTDIYISGFEVGSAILFPASSIEHDFPAGKHQNTHYRAANRRPR